MPGIIPLIPDGRFGVQPARPAAVTLSQHSLERDLLSFLSLDAHNHVDYSGTLGDVRK